MGTYEQRVNTTDHGRAAARRATTEPMAAATLNFLLGTWLFVSHWVLSYTNSDPIWNDVVFGLAIGVFALIRLSGKPVTRFVSVFNMAIGAWLVVAGLTIASSTAALVNNIACGAVVFLIAAFASLFPSERAL